MAKITMPFFQATSTKLPLTKEIVNVSGNDLPSAGPYYMSRNDVRPADVSSGRTSTGSRARAARGRGTSPASTTSGTSTSRPAFNQVKANELDEGPLPAAEVQGVASQYGVNKTRFWTKPVNCTGYLPMNTANSLFKNNLPLRQAVNYAISRKPYVAQAGPYAGQPWTHLFNPGVPGWRNVSIYKQNMTKAKEPRPDAPAGREDHGLLPLVRDDEPRPGPDRQAGPGQPRVQRRQHQHEAVLRRRHLHGNGPQGHRCRHGRLDGLVLGLPGPVRLDQHPPVRPEHSG